jgi:hypothetical protein
MKIPLISVSQKPIDFGQNICVGCVGASSQNAFRQFQIGTIAAKTRFVVPAEADFLYPPQYFDFRPDREDVFYLAQPLWVAFAQRGFGRHFCRKPRGSEAAMMVGRETLLKRFDVVLQGMDQWGLRDADGVTWPWLLNRHHIRRSELNAVNPVVTFKTDRNMHKKTPHSENERLKDLPYWGNIYDLIRQYSV